MPQEPPAVFPTSSEVVSSQIGTMVGTIENQNRDHESITVLQEARQGFNGLAIELKRDKGRATPEQKKWREQLLERGYRSVICKGREACLEEIRSYFKEDNLDL